MIDKDSVLTLDDTGAVVPFTGPTKVELPFAPNVDVVKTLETALELARSGKLTSVALAWTEHDGLCADAQNNCAWKSPRGMKFALGESITRLRWRWDTEGYN